MYETSSHFSSFNADSLITGSQDSERAGITWKRKPRTTNCHCLFRSRLRQHYLQ